jgi:hypothetical protein
LRSAKAAARWRNTIRETAVVKHYQETQEGQTHAADDTLVFNDR